jgi:hypothetical protein
MAHQSQIINAYWACWASAARGMQYNNTTCLQRECDGGKEELVSASMTGDPDKLACMFDRMKNRYRCCYQFSVKEYQGMPGEPPVVIVRFSLGKDRQALQNQHNDNEGDKAHIGRTCYQPLSAECKAWVTFALSEEVMEVCIKLGEV